MYRLRKLLVFIQNLYGKLLFQYYPSRFRKLYQLGLEDLKIGEDGSKPLSIIFVCQGNICRSPYAERRIVEYWNKDDTLQKCPLRVSSIGLDTRDGKPANEQACKVALRRNVDLSSHLATVADGHALSEADLVFLMEYKHARGVIDLYRYCAKKTVMLGSFGLPAYPLTIQDPYGRPPEEFEECFSQIDNALQNFIHTAKQHIA